MNGLIQAATDWLNSTDGERRLKDVHEEFLTKDFATKWSPDASATIRTGIPATTPGEAPNTLDYTITTRAYVDAGSQVVLTNTFGANRIRLAEVGAGLDVAAINRAGVGLSKRAAAGRALVFASIGPSGKLLLTGDVSPEDLERAEGLLQAMAPR